MSKLSVYHYEVLCGAHRFKEWHVIRQTYLHGYINGVWQLNLHKIKNHSFSKACNISCLCTHIVISNEPRFQYQHTNDKIPWPKSKKLTRMTTDSYMLNRCIHRLLHYFICIISPNWEGIAYCNLLLMGRVLSPILKVNTTNDLQTTQWPRPSSDIEYGACNNNVQGSHDKGLLSSHNSQNLKWQTCTNIYHLSLCYHMTSDTPLRRFWGPNHLQRKMKILLNQNYFLF